MKITLLENVSETEKARLKTMIGEAFVTNDDQGIIP